MSCKFERSYPHSCMKFTSSLDEAYDGNAIEFCPRLDTCPKWNPKPPQKSDLTKDGREFLNDFSARLRSIYGNREPIPCEEAAFYEKLQHTPLLKREFLKMPYSIPLRAFVDSGLLSLEMLGDTTNIEAIIKHYVDQSMWEDMPQALKFPIILGVSKAKPEELVKVEKRVRKEYENETLDALNFPKITTQDVLHGHIVDTLKRK